MNDIPILQIDVIDTEQHVAESRLEMQRMRNYMLRNEVNACELCGFGFTNILQVHHKIPLSKGGTNHPLNLIVLCPNCHALVHETARRTFRKLGRTLAKQKQESIDFRNFKNALESEVGAEMAGRIFDLAMATQ